MWWVFLTILGGRGALRAASLRWRRYAAGAWRVARGEAAAGGWWWHVVGLPDHFGRAWGAARGFVAVAAVRGGGVEAGARKGGGGRVVVACGGSSGGTMAGRGEAWRPFSALETKEKWGI
jgi:hypothetical protein